MEIFVSYVFDTDFTLGVLCETLQTLIHQRNGVYWSHSSFISYNKYYNFFSIGISYP